MRFIKKQYYYYSIIVFIVFLVLIVNIYYFLNAQNKLMNQVMQKHAKIFSTQIEDDLTSVYKELIYLANSEHLQVLLDNEDLDSNISGKLKLFYEKYNDIVKSIILVNQHSQRIYYRDKGNYYHLSGINYIDNFLNPLKYTEFIQYEKDFIEIIIPLKNQNNKIESNLKVVLDVKGYINHQLKKYYIGGQSWYFLINNEGQINTVFFEEEEIEIHKVTLEGLTEIRKAIESGLDGSIIHTISNESKKQTLYSGYSVIRVFNKNFGVIISTVRDKIYYPLIISTVFFVLLIIVIITIFILIFRLFTLKIKRSKIETIESVNSFRILIQSLPIGIVIFNENEEISLFNTEAQRIFEISNIQNVLGKKIDEISDSNLVFSLKYKTKEESEVNKICLVYHQEKKYILKPMTSEHLLHDLVTVQVFIDITEQEKAIQVSQETNKVKSEFISIVSHEIRTPLSTIKGFSELLSKKDLDEEARFFNNNIEKASQQLLNILNNIIELAQLDSQASVITMFPFSFQHLFQEFELKYKAVTHLDFISSCPTNIPPVIGDLNKIKTIISKILENAFKFTKEGYVQLIIDLLEERDEEVLVKVIIKDTGVGISQDKKSFIFEPFMQGDSSFSREYGGIGIGLAICSKLAKILNSYIALDYSNENGSSFSFILQLKKQNKAESHINSIDSEG